ncbi:MAG: hypothetical protein VW397_07315, partial [Candidatus Margulisiibacteriota bacterium]
MFKVFIVTLLFVTSVIAKPSIYLISHQNIPAYNLAINAIKSNLESDFDIKIATVDRQSVDVVAKAIKKDRPKLTITVGTKATKLIQSKLKREHILFTMVFRPERTDLVK